MTLQTTIADIDESYPVAGVDNNTQGFRDNFAAIKNSLSLADSELTNLQENTVKVADLITNDPVENNLQGSSLVNGYYGNFHGVAYVSPAINGSTTVTISNGPLQVFTLNAANIADTATFTFTGWPGTPSQNYYAQVRVHFYSNTTEPAITVDELTVGKKYTIVSATGTSNTIWNTIAGTTGKTYSDGMTFIAAQNGAGTGTVQQWREVTLQGAVGANMYFENELTLPFRIDPNSLDPLNPDILIDIDPMGVHSVIDAWSYDGGANVFIKSLGKFTYPPTDNHTIVGDLSVAGSITDDVTLGSDASNMVSVVGDLSIAGSITDDVTLGSTTSNIITINGIPQFPSLNATERDGLEVATVGMVIFNTTTVKLQVCTVGGTGGSATWNNLN